MESVKLPKTHWPIALTEHSTEQLEPETQVTKPRKPGKQFESSAHLTELVKLAVHRQAS